MEVASRIASKTGCRLLNSTFPARVDGGPGRISVERLPYFPEQILAALKGTEHLILVGGEIPASFFAYRGIPDRWCRRVVKCPGCPSLKKIPLRHFSGWPNASARCNQKLRVFRKQTSANPRENWTTNRRFRLLPPLCRKTSSSALIPAAETLPILLSEHGPKQLAQSYGGAIGQGGPCATGAALACPDRPVLALLGDGGAAYTIQCLWTQAREQQNVTTVIFANNSYNILNVEYARLGVDNPGDIANSLFDIGNPEIDWVDLAKGFGVPGAKAQSADDFCTLLEKSYATPGPFLIQAGS